VSTIQLAATHLLAGLGLLEALRNIVRELLDAGGVEDVGLARDVLDEVARVVRLGRVRLDRELWASGVSRGGHSRWFWSPWLLPDMVVIVRSSSRKS
jgi:hypothetical protein